MSHQHLKERAHYEDTYDRHTVELAREKRASRVSKQSQTALIGIEPKFNTAAATQWLESMWELEAYFFSGERWESREATIKSWMERDAANDAQLESARLAKEPACSHCGRLGLRIFSKDLLHREGSDTGAEQVVFMLKCPHCERNSAYWEDGTEWELKPTLCPNCNSEMAHKTTQRGKVHTTTYACPDCGHNYQEKITLGANSSVEDPEFERDKAKYCLSEKSGQEFVEDMARWQQLQEIFKEQDERDANKDLYEAVAKIQKLKITQPHKLLRPVIEEAGFTEVRFAEPEIGRDVIVSISCLDGDSKREDYDSRKALKKAVVTVLEPTNWRLVSSGFEYRLGYLNGRVRAYEKEADLIKLAQSLV